MKTESEKKRIPIDAKKYWIKWLVTETEDGESLECSGYELVHNLEKREDNNDLCFIPLTYVEDQIERSLLLHILRTPRHRPEDPDELVNFIKSIHEFIEKPID